MVEALERAKGSEGMFKEAVAYYKDSLITC
jgi:hypothetical protein